MRTETKKRRNKSSVLFKISSTQGPNRVGKSVCPSLPEDGNKESLTQCGF